MKEIKKLKKLWMALTPPQTFALALLARWYLLTNAYANLPYALRRRLFNRELYKSFPAHWLR